ncbi:MAG: low-specificity L-threonine aldolase [Sedimentisphaerales bacterium]|nr:low-specificity L-threonine aldolase [Sedimentisphaerales bacterium]
MIDLRSDTITRPTPAMRQAMADAEVGDDVLGDDPTVKQLERQTARLLGKEAAVFMPSGTMTNQAAIRAHTEPGDEILCDANAHCYYYEAGGPAGLSGVMCRLLPGRRGIFSAGDLRAALRPRNLHFPPTKLVCVENTHNRGGGAIWPLEQIAEVAEAAREANLALHLDGARLWNAAIASGLSERTYAKYFDTVSVCFSKGLGAPVGSVLAGTKALIDRARRFRKMFGGAMRQAGILAAGALYALENHRLRLAQDHANARRLAEGIAELPGIALRPAEVETNMVLIRLTDRPADRLAVELEQAGLRMLAVGPDTLRAVTHLDVSAEQIEEAIGILHDTLTA